MIRAMSKDIDQGENRPNIFAVIKNITLFLEHGIRISEIIRWDRKSYLTQGIYTRLSREGYIH